MFLARAGLDQFVGLGFDLAGPRSWQTIPGSICHKARRLIASGCALETASPILL
jgi:hypothetical protein